MPIQDNRATGGGGAVDSVNGQTGAVVLTAAGLEAGSELQEDCLDNATTNVTIGSASSNERYEIGYVLKLNVSGKKHVGKIVAGYDGSVIFDHEYSYHTTEIPGVDLSVVESAGNLVLVVDLSAVGENTKLRYTKKVVSQIV